MTKNKKILRFTLLYSLSDMTIGDKKNKLKNHKKQFTQICAAVLEPETE